MVLCSKFHQEMPGLSEPPFPGPLGKLIKDRVSEQAWREWVEAEIKIINEERLDLSEEKSQQRLFQAMIEYLELGDLVEL